MPKITPEHFGKKMRLKIPNYRENWFFIPYFFTEDGEIAHGLGQTGRVEAWHNTDNWELYEEPKKKVIKRMAPGLMKDRYEENYFISRDIFSSKEDFEEYYNNRSHTFDLIKWPASEAMFCEIEVEE